MTLGSLLLYKLFSTTLVLFKALGAASPSGEEIRASTPRNLAKNQECSLATCFGL